MRKQALSGLLLIFTIFCLSVHLASAQVAGKQVPIKVPITMSSPNALLYLPWDYNISNKTYPLICFFHGMGEAGTNLNTLAGQGLPGVIAQGNPPYAVNSKGDTTRFIVLSIQATWWSPSPATMIAGISTLINDYHLRIDTNRIYPTGLSAGGEESLYAIENYINDAPLYYPSKVFAAAVVMSPATGIYSSVINNFKNKYIWFFQGIYDHTVNPLYAYNGYDTVNAHFPGHARLTKYPSGHCCWMQFYEPTYKELIGSDSMSIYDWMMQYDLNSENGISTLRQPPTVSAGSNQIVTLPVDSVMLVGTASANSGGKLVSYQWAEKSGPSSYVFRNDTALKTEVAGLTAGTYIFTLTVTDDSGSVASAYVTVTVNPAAVNAPPVANAGSNQTITLPVDSVLLDGSASSDSDGTIVSYNWTKKSGPAAFNMANANSAKTEVTGLDTGTYVFTLTVTDDSGVTASANVSVIVKDSVVTTPPPPHQPPIANAGSNQTITLPVDSVLLDGSASSDSDGTIVSYNWTKKSGPAAFNITNVNNAKTEVTGLDTGTYVFTLTVTDDSGATNSANVSVMVKDSVVTTPPPLHQPLVANAGSNQTITLPVDSVALDGTASSDSGGKIVSYLWTKKSGPAAFTIANSNSAKTEVTGLDTGTYIFTLAVTGDSGATASADVSVIVKDSVVATALPNRPPVANAGNNQTITLPSDSILLDGSGSSDPDGKIVSYNWVKKSGPAAYTIDSVNNAKTEVTGLDTGTYVFTLTVTDDSGATAFADVTVIVNKSVVLGNINNPVADAGPDQITTMPLNTVTLNGSGTVSKNTTNGYIFYHWEKVSGPGQYFIQFPYKAVTQIQNLAVGTYVFKLTIHINSGPEASDTVQVIVRPDPVQPGDVSSTANTQVLPYTQLFQYGSNTGAYSNGWSDTSVAGIALNAGVHTIRIPLPEYFIERYNYDIRLNEFNYYTHQLGMKENTLFVGEPGPMAVDSTIYPTNTQISSVFKNLYTPIWDNGQNGTPVNDSNYFAVYIYNLVMRYGKDVRFWEIVNEPDMTGFTDNGNASRPDSWWNVPPQPEALLNLRAPIFNYIRMLRIAYEVIKKIEPDDYVAPGGIGYPAFLDALLRYTDNPDSGKVTPEYPYTGGAYFDVLSFHDYPAYSLRYWNNAIQNFTYLRYSDRAADAVINLKNVLDSVLENRGYNDIKYPKKPFILTETNVSQKTFTNSDGSQYYGATDFQRNYVIKILIEAQQNDIKQLYLFGIGDGADYNNATSPYQLMGIYGNLGTQGPGQQQLTEEGMAYKTTSMLLYGWRYDSTRTQQLNLPDSIDGAAFKKDTQYRYVLWAKTHIDMSEAASATYSFPASLNIDSLHSYQWNYSVDTTAQGKVSAQNVALTGSPIFLMAAPFVDSTHVPPVADAGKNQTIMLPTDSVTLDGSGSMDQDGTIVSYQWTQTAGPGTASIDTANPVHPLITGLTAGVYTFQLTVTDDHDATDSDSVSVTVNNKVNLYPIPNAGINQTIILPVNSVTLDGSSSLDPDGTIVKYQWTEQSGPSSYTFSNANAPVTSASNLEAGTYVFTLTVTDNDGASASSNVIVFVNTKANQPPVANAGNNITIQLPDDSVLLDGSKSSDPNGTIASYQWSQQSGPSTAIFGPPNGSAVQVSQLTAGTYIFTLTVTDNEGASNSSTVSVTVKPAANIPPVANAGSNQTITLPLDSVLLDGSASYDPDGMIVSYRWTKSSGPSSGTINNADSSKAEVSNFVSGTYVFVLTVTDNSGASTSADVTITVNGSNPVTPSNQPPVANAGNNQSITLPVDSVVLDGSSSSDPDGKIVSYYWTKSSGPAAGVIKNDSSVKTDIANLAVGTYVFTLTVTDNGGASASANVTVIVNDSVAASPKNQPPVANAGNNQTITLPVDSVTLDGTASHDPDGTILSYQWTKNSGPSSGTINNATSAKTGVSGLAAGTYVFTLTVTDDSGASAFANVTITVNPQNPITSPNRPPVANAGNNQSITLPVDSVTLDGSASYDPDGKIVSYLWIKRSGPASVSIENDSSAKTVVNNLTTGTYVFTLTVTDNEGATTSANVTITVNDSVAAPPQNQPPIANAGGNQTITLPVNSVTLDGSASYDPDGKIVSYKWTEKSGPSSFIIADTGAATTQVSNLYTGIYVFTLTVTDNQGAKDSANVTITVYQQNIPPNQPPVANAGSNQTITLPVNSVTLDGSSSYDPDGTIFTYQWTQQSGPAAGNINNAPLPKTTVSNLDAGTYIFTLTVTDNSGASTSANVTVTVIPANLPPVANAGNNTNIFLPNDSTLLDGSASYDPDGKIVSWSWSQKSGPGGANILQADSARTLVNSLANGTYVFTLIVTDNGGAKDTANVTIGVYQKPDQPPVANAGQDITIVLPQSSVTLDGTASYDPDGKIVTYHWESMTGPSQAKLLSPDAPTTIVSGLQMGTYDFKLTVTDNKGVSSTATVSVYVMPARNTSPTTFTIYPNPVHDQLHVELNKAITGLLEFRIIDVNGRILKVYRFGQLPMHVTEVLDVSGLAPGIYFIQLIEDNQLRDVRKMIKY